MVLGVPGSVSTIIVCGHFWYVVCPSSYELNSWEPVGREAHGARTSTGDIGPEHLEGKLSDTRNWAGTFGECEK